ncbi:hypothetical protein K502DRAFT_325492 [Neoconidiobolus thromboides FSU 785]|nr:hypothetical protein K502DRAFT_325492 [Neoconidiobolus thromboides FSU 785]
MSELNFIKSESISPKQKERVVLSMAQRLEIVNLGEQHGLSHQEIATQFNVGRSTVTKILLNKEKIKRISKGVSNDLRKRIRTSEFDELERRLAVWCTKDAIINDKGILELTSEHDSSKIEEKAQELAVELKLSNFSPNSRWLVKFRRKFKLGFKNIVKSKEDNNQYVNQNIYNQIETIGFQNSLLFNSNSSGFNNEFYDYRNNLDYSSVLLNFNNNLWHNNYRTSSLDDIFNYSNINDCNYTQPYVNEFYNLFTDNNDLSNY